MEDRFNTYIKGFDEIVPGGLPRGEVILIIGSAGTMKSSISMYMLYMNAINNRTTGLYICLEEERAAFIENMSSIGIDFSKNLSTLHIHGSELRTYLDEKAEQRIEIGMMAGQKSDSAFVRSLKYTIQQLKERKSLEFLVIDSLDSLVLVSEMREPRDEIFKFFEWAKDTNITTFIIGETPGTGAFFSPNENYCEDFLADGIIQVKMEKTNDINYRRYIRCVKMRSVEHSPDYFVLSFDDREKIFEVSRALY